MSLQTNKINCYAGVEDAEWRGGERERGGGDHRNQHVARNIDFVRLRPDSVSHPVHGGGKPSKLSRGRQATLQKTISIRGGTETGT